ncbi:MAG: hypothetical protein UW60_C0017G0013 [Candidatus Woesebacteria bacterium GW2011_GWA2_44_33]|uniref:Glycosyltransferase RgtA/B/C/D-like domain-containing protein n=2 Tax=Candidatus Woeseibacteriota TaxID=1752722 RepID=A0A0G1NA38_9BACT|nr:MAG: hypothetical protein UW60_C0017G0013 [Candidatus Woesebacteria bacterium GW2011_GWA2_44_33]KKU17192.1 MAG: hypothetical protein UX25_C0014G0011 [Candidatus Woesebacteria bacterium GW2011_GWC2_45_9]
MKKKVLIALFAIFVLALALRVIFLPQGSLLFMYDMARDAWVVDAILKGDFKILGPPASTPGLFHGVFYYYLLAPAYLLGKGSPLVASAYLAFLNSLGVLIVYYLTKLITKKPKTSLLAAFFYAISFGVSQYAAWLSNPSIALWTVPLIYLGLWLWLAEGKAWGPVVTGLGLGLSMQAEIFLGYHFIPILLWLWVERARIKRKSLLVFLIVFLATASSIILAEMKFGFKGIAAVASIFFSEDVFVKFRSLGDFIVLYLNQMGRVFSLTLLPSNVGYGGFLGIVIIVLAYKNWRKEKVKRRISWQPFLISYVLSHLAIVSLGGISTPFLTAGLEVGIIILAAIFVEEFLKKERFLAGFFLLLLVVSNLGLIFKENKKGQTNFAIQKDMTLARQLEVVNYTYQESRGSSFSINTFTSPLFMNTLWSYLYNWYGKGNYGYLPEWTGRDQVDQLGNNLPLAQKETKLHFFIIEPMQGIPEHFLVYELGAEDVRSQLVEERRFGEIRVQKRYAK